MTKVLYISNFHDGTGYSEAAIRNVKAIATTDIDIVCRNIIMTSAKDDKDEMIKELCQKDIDDVDVVIQHTLPSHFVYIPDVKNIGMFAYETTKITNKCWANNIKMMDKIIVFNNTNKDTVSNFFDKDIEVVPHPVTDKRSYRELEFRTNRSEKIFYTISENNRRKNLATLVASYLITFDYKDNVKLVIKSDPSIINPIKETRTNLGRFRDETKYPKIIAITERVSDDYIMDLHNTCDTYVNTSFGEAFCIPAFDAISKSNELIAPNFMSFKDFLSYLPQENIQLIDGEQINVLFAYDQLGIYNAEEEWFKINNKLLCEAMRKSYDGINPYVSFDNFSKGKVGLMFKKVLETQ